MIAKRKLKYVAICIGINEYANYETLNNAVHDATAISDVFQKLKFEVIRLFDHDATNSAFDQLCNDLKERHEKEHFDAIILYFAGHGCLINLSDCLVLQDTIGLTSSNNYIVKKQSINVQEFINFYRDVFPPTIVVIMDACRTDLSNYRGHTRGLGSLPFPGIGAGVKGVNQAFIAYSTSIDTEADDVGGKDGHSPYTAALLEEIPKEMPIESVFKNARNKIHRHADDQLPWEYTCLTSDFYFNYGQLDPYYDAEYSKDAFMYYDYTTQSDVAKKILYGLSQDTPFSIEATKELLLKHKDMFSEDDLFVIGRKIYSTAVKNQYADEQFLNVQTLRIFGNKINHLLRGIYYEIYFDEKNDLRSRLLGSSRILTIIDRLQSLLKDEDAAKFVKKYVNSKGGDPRYEIWDMSSVVNVDVEVKEMNCTDEHNNAIYGICKIMVDDENILSKLHEDATDIVNHDQLRRQIAECLSTPLQRMKIKGLEKESEQKVKYVLYFVDNIEEQLRETINMNIPDEISILSSNSYVDDLGDVKISEVTYDGSDVYIEGSCWVDVHIEFDGEDMGNCSFPCSFNVKLYYDDKNNEYMIDHGAFKVNTDSYYK